MPDHVFAELPQDEAADLLSLAHDTAADAQAYLDAVTELAAGSLSETEISVLLLPLSKLLLTGARLGANRDVVPSERFEPDSGPDPELDPLRGGLANFFEGVDEYADIVDPMTAPEMVRGILSDDLADVAADLVHGLRHYRSGRIDEALWWFQFSYLSTWGSRAASALRVLQSMVSHLRLDVDDDTVADAEFDALHAH
jgi:hypothetical protein